MRMAASWTDVELNQRIQNAKIPATDESMLVKDLLRK